MIKKLKLALLTLCLLLAALSAYALAAGGDASDPLASLSYLTGPFTDAVDEKVAEKLDEAAGSGESSAGSSSASWQELRLKEGDFLLLAGSGRFDFSAGTVVDVTTGTPVASGTALTVNHRYLVAEDTAASFLVTSKTAVVDYQGTHTLSASNSTDYNAIASALKTLHLFQGSFTGYGSGYDLEVVPTRLQALIMFIRVLGEEEEALAYTGGTPFTDITPDTQSEKYVGYALSKGYTNGYSATTFRPSQTVTASQYVEFLLRALGYSSAENKDLSATLTNALANGVITPGELAALQSGTFLRADLAYVSYYALDALVAGSDQTLGQLKRSGTSYAGVHKMK